MKSMRKVKYFDREFREGTCCVWGKRQEDTDYLWIGKQYDPFVMTCEENGFTALQRKRDIKLIWEGMIPKVDFYPVPSLTLFAHDGRGGYFAHDGNCSYYSYENKPLMESKIFFISKELECWYLAENFRSFVQMVIFEPDWKEIITGEKAENNETEEELADFGILFGFSVPEEKLSRKINKTDAFKIYENYDKAMGKLCTL